MIRSLLVILLAVVCGASAAIGAYQLASKRAATTSSVTTETVFVAAQPIRRGAAVKDEDIKVVKWPADLTPEGVIKERHLITNRSALAGITKDEPFFKAKLSDASGSGFASNAIAKGMRACTIQTTGPSASVAGFVRPGDRVDVLLNLRGTANDETGGGSTLTLLQAVEILAIDDILDMDSATVKMWLKEGLASVTLLVTPDQALQLSLGQSSGTLSLSLRNGDDLTLAAAPPVTIRDVRHSHPLTGQLAAANPGPVQQAATDPAPVQQPAASPAPDIDARGNSDEPPAVESPRNQGPLPSFIRTLRGTQSGEIRVVIVGEARR